MLPFIFALDENWGRVSKTKFVKFLIQDSGVILWWWFSACAHTADWTCKSIRILGWFSVVSFSGFLHSATSSHCCPNPCATNIFVREATLSANLNQHSPSCTHFYRVTTLFFLKTQNIQFSMYIFMCGHICGDQRTTCHHMCPGFVTDTFNCWAILSEAQWQLLSKVTFPNSSHSPDPFTHALFPFPLSE